MIENAIRDRLVEQGEKLFNEPKPQLIKFTNKTEADKLLNDLDNHPHAFVLGCIMNRQVKSERAMIIPYLISRKLGSFSLKTLSQLTLDEVSHLMGHPEPLHRFVDKMSEVFYSAIQRIVNHYESNAANIWLGKPLSAEVVYRFLEFEGVGLKIASMVTNILARDFRVPFADYFSIDISPDVHIRRVFTRLGLCPEGVSAEQVIYKAKALHPEFPGIMDLSCWDIGRNWCNSRNPKCGKCCMNDLCPTANRKK